MIPNSLSIFRLISSIFIILLFEEKYYLSSFALFIFSGFSDFLDGFLARKLNQTSNLGTILDPVADKVLIFTLFFFFSYKNEIPFFLFLISVIRDVAIILVSIYLILYKKVKHFTPIFVSKINTTFQLFLIFVCFFEHAINIDFITNSGILECTKSVLIVFTTITLCISSISYCKEFIRICRK